MELEHKDGDTYLITGFYHNSRRRFRLTTSNPRQAIAINLWNGAVWQVRNGKRKLVYKVTN